MAQPIDICINNGYTYFEVIDMKATVNKWGNSLGIRIPNAIIKDLHLEEGSRVDIIEENDKIVIYPKKDMLKDLINSISEKNIHEEMDSGASIGNEAW
jgi:antitoxin MazE